MLGVLKLFGILGLLIAVLFFIPRQIPREEGAPSAPQEVLSPVSTTTSSTIEVTMEVPEKRIERMPQIEGPAIKTLPPADPIVVPPPPEPSGLILEKDPPKSSLPPLDEEAIRRAVVKIECPTSSGIGKYVGSGFVISGNQVVTAAHVVINSGSNDCNIIFPNTDRKPVHYLRGTLESLDVVRDRHNKEGIDIAIFTLPPVASYPEAEAIFSDAYPVIPYPICQDPFVIGDEMLHFGYPSNFVDQNYLSQMIGKAVAHADVTGVEEKLSLDGTFSYKNPILEFSDDETRFHPYSVSRVATFYGDSGGLAFNKTKQCILGIHRSATIGRTSGDNYSIFMNLGWEGASRLLK